MELLQGKKLFNINYTPEEIELLPPKHNAKKDPNMLVSRNVIQILDFKMFKKFENRKEVIFENAKPLIKEDS